MGGKAPQGRSQGGDFKGAAVRKELQGPFPGPRRKRHYHESPGRVCPGVLWSYPAFADGEASKFSRSLLSFVLDRKLIVRCRVPVMQAVRAPGEHEAGHRLLGQAPEPAATQQFAAECPGEARAARCSKSRPPVRSRAGSPSLLGDGGDLRRFYPFSWTCFSSRARRTPCGCARSPRRGPRGRPEPPP